MNPYVFFLGCPRSGTTLLQRLGNAHPLLAVINEIQWVPKWWERRAGVAPDGTVTTELVRKLLAHRRFPRLELQPQRVAELVREGEPKPYARFVRELFDLHGEIKGKRLVGEKSPTYVRHLPTLHELFPEARVVHLLRDGRDVALSALDWKKGERILGRSPTWKDDPLTTAALWWEWHVRLGREAAGLLGSERYHELFYESLVAEPERECMRLCTFLGIAYDATMLRFHEGRMKPKPGRGAKAAWLPVTRGLRNWAEQMAPAEVRHFEAAAGLLLQELGYAPGAETISAEEFDRAARLRAAFAAGARARGRAVPEAWSVAA